MTDKERGNKEDREIGQWRKVDKIKKGLEGKQKRNKKGGGSRKKKGENRKKDESRRNIVSG